MNAEVFLIHYSTFIRIIHRRDLHRHGLRHRDLRYHDRLRRCDPHHHHDHCHRQSRYFPPLVHARGHCYLPVLELAPDPDQAEDRVQEVLARFPGAKLVEVRRLAAEPPESDASMTEPGEDGMAGEESPDDSDNDF